jgi:hypothetical protein
MGRVGSGFGRLGAIEQCLELRGRVSGDEEVVEPDFAFVRPRRQLDDADVGPLLDQRPGERGFGLPHVRVRGPVAVEADVDSPTCPPDRLEFRKQGPEPVVPGPAPALDPRQRDDREPALTPGFGFLLAFDKDQWPCAGNRVAHAGGEVRLHWRPGRPFVLPDLLLGLVLLVR